MKAHVHSTPTVCNVVVQQSAEVNNEGSCALYTNCTQFCSVASGEEIRTQYLYCIKCQAGGKCYFQFFP